MARALEGDRARHHKFAAVIESEIFAKVDLGKL